MKEFVHAIKFKSCVFVLFILLVMGLSGCKGNKWDEAYSYYSNAKYQEAYEIFSTLGNYKNSTNLARNSKLIIDIDSAELMIENHEYNRALELLLPYIDDGVDNKYASIDIRNADSTAINLVHKCKSAIEGNWIDTFSLSGNELSGTIFLTSIIDSPRLELRFLTNNDSYIGETYITDPADYGENITYGELVIQNYQTEVGYVFDKLNLSQLSFTIPKAASWYENDIFTPATVSDLYAFSLTGLISTAVSQGGKQGYMPALGALKNIHFSNFQKVFKNGELTVRLLSGNDIYLESVFRIK